MSGTERPLAWDEHTGDGWFEAVEQWKWQYDPEKNEYWKGGTCPRCAHRMGRTLSQWTILDQDPTTDIRCNCDAFHPGRPHGKVGCGSGGRGFSLPQELVRGDAPTRQGPARTPSDAVQRRWEEKAQELEFTALDQVRAGAEKWGTTITALTGVFGLTTLLKGPGDVTLLVPDLRVAVGIVLLVAALLALGAITLAAFAAQGQPRLLWNSGHELRAHHKEAARKAGSQLTWSRGLMVASLMALLVAIGLMWYGPRAPSAVEHVIAIQQSGPALCGELAVDERGRLGLRAKGREVTTLGQVVSISRIEKCP